MMKKTLMFLLLALPIGVFIAPEGVPARASSDPGMSQEKQTPGLKMAKMMGETEYGKASKETEARWGNKPWERERWHSRKWRSRWHPRRHSPKPALSQITGDFHQWIECLMDERDDLDLASDQYQRLDKTLTDYFKGLISTEAAAASAMVQLKYDLRQAKVDLPAVQTQLKTVSENEYMIQLNAIKTYLSILDILTPQQRQTLDEKIGSAFPAMWRPMSQWEPRKGDEEHGWKSEKHEKDED
jgi:Spy/CpxP family protein refolding chaperone